MAVNVKVTYPINYDTECTVIWDCAEKATFILEFPKNDRPYKWRACDRHLHMALNDAVINGDKIPQPV